MREATILRGRQKKNEQEHKTDRERGREKKIIKHKESNRQSQFQSEVPRHGATLPPVDESLELQRGAASSSVLLF